MPLGLDQLLLGPDLDRLLVDGDLLGGRELRQLLLLRDEQVALVGGGLGGHGVEDGGDGLAIDDGLRDGGGGGDELGLKMPCNCEARDISISMRIVTVTLIIYLFAIYRVNHQVREEL